MKKRRMKNVIYGVLTVIIVVTFLSGIITLLLVKSASEMSSIILISALFLTYILVILILEIHEESVIRKLSSNYVRDIPGKYDLPTTAFLHDNSIDINPLIAAFNLKLRRIGIIDDQNRIINSKKIEELSKNEYYLLNLLYFNDNDEYSVYGFKDELYQNLQKENLLKDKIPNHMVSAIVIIFIVTGLIVTNSILCIAKIITYEQWDKHFGPIMFPLMILFAVYIILIHLGVINKNNNKRWGYTKIAKEERRNIMGFYGFLKNFSSLDEKEMIESTLWNEYLEYAVLFRINNKYINENVNLITQNELYDILEKIGTGKINN